MFVKDCNKASDLRSKCHAVDKDEKPVVVLSKEFINSMMKSYGFSRMLSGEEDFLETISEYNIGVNGGKINRFDEFLEYFGDGDAEQGLKYIEEDLKKVSLGAYFISAVFDEKKNRYETKEKFIGYLKKGMSK